MPGKQQSQLNHYHIFTNSSVDLIYTDIAKVFDSVSHPKLISVLSFYGIMDNLLKWVECFLTNRTQLVCLNNQYSSILPVGSVVPQHSRAIIVHYLYEWCGWYRLTVWWFKWCICMLMMLNFSVIIQLTFNMLWINFQIGCIIDNLTQDHFLLRQTFMVTLWF